MESNCREWKIGNERKRGEIMSEHFDRRLHCAAAAGWWTLLIAVGVFLIQWALYLLVVPAQPGWVLTLWGPGATWQEVRNLWFLFIAGFKVCLLVVAFILVWLTLWVRQLRKTLKQPIG